MYGNIKVHLQIYRYCREENGSTWIIHTFVDGDFNMKSTMSEVYTPIVQVYQILYDYGEKSTIFKITKSVFSYFV